jgi:hypothetical protein
MHYGIMKVPKSFDQMLKKRIPQKSLKKCGNGMIIQRKKE